jgi:hypothetical protein
LAQLILGLFLLLVIALLTFLLSHREQEFSGVWVSTFENSAFYEGETAETWTGQKGDPSGWLVMRTSHSGSTMLEREGQQPCEAYSAYEIRFIGWRRIGATGHMDMYPAEYSVEQVLSIKPATDKCAPPINDGILIDETEGDAL